MLVWVCREQRGRRSGSTRGLPGGLPEGKERTEDQPEGGQGGGAAGGEPREAAAAQGEGAQSQDDLDLERGRWDQRLRKHQIG